MNRVLIAFGIWLIALPVGAVTSYAQLTVKLKADVARRPEMLRLYAIGQSAKWHKTIWMVRVAPTNSEKALRSNLRMLIICRQHGDEPVSTEAILQLIHNYSTWNSSHSLKNITLYIVPMANPDGADLLTRLTGVHADLNRDWGEFTQPETQAIYSAYSQIKPQLVVDMHSWTKDDSFQSNSIEITKAGWSSSRIAAQTAQLQRRIIDSVKSNDGASIQPIICVKPNDPTLCHRFFALERGVVSLLIETASGGNSDPEMSERIAIDQTAINSLIGSMNNQRSSWLALARSEKSLIAPESEYTEPDFSLSIVERTIKPSAPVVIRKLTKRDLLAAIFAYIGVCLILAKLLGRQILSSVRRLTQKQSAPKLRLVAGKGAVYVPVRSRRKSVLRHADEKKPLERVA